MREVLNKIKDGLLNVIIPIACVGCGKEGNYICDKCDLFLSEATSIFAKGNLKEVISVWEYEGLIKKLIHKIKYEGVSGAVNELVTKAFKRRELYIPEDMIITFVPMFKKKERIRGFNQAELIAKKLGEMTNRKVVPLLEKVKDTPSQTELNKEERIENVKGTFGLSKPGFSLSKPGFENVLIVDDVWTSGATMEECSRILRKAGAKNVQGFTLARTA